MPLVYCKSCGKLFQNTEPQCPHCGTPLPRPTIRTTRTQAEEAPKPLGPSDEELRQRLEEAKQRLAEMEKQQQEAPAPEVVEEPAASEPAPEPEMKEEEPVAAVETETPQPVAEPEPVAAPEPETKEEEEKNAQEEPAEEKEEVMPNTCDCMTDNKSCKDNTRCKKIVMWVALALIIACLLGFGGYKWYMNSNVRYAKLAKEYCASLPKDCVVLGTNIDHRESTVYYAEKSITNPGVFSYNLAKKLGGQLLYGGKDVEGHDVVDYMIVDHKMTDKNLFLILQPFKNNPKHAYDVVYIDFLNSLPHYLDYGRDAVFTEDNQIKVTQLLTRRWEGDSIKITYEERDVFYNMNDDVVDLWQKCQDTKNENIRIESQFLVDQKPVEVKKDTVVAKEKKVVAEKPVKKAESPAAKPAERPVAKSSQGSSGTIAYSREAKVNSIYDFTEKVTAQTVYVPIDEESNLAEDQITRIKEQINRSIEELNRLEYLDAPTPQQITRMNQLKQNILSGYNSMITLGENTGNAQLIKYARTEKAKTQDVLNTLPY